MHINIINLKLLMEEKANGNYHEFSRQTGISVPSLFKILNHQRNAGTKVISLIMVYLKNNEIPYENYIFLP